MQPLAHLALVVVQLLFASLAIGGRFVLPHFPAGALVTVRVLGATLVLLALNTIMGEVLPDGPMCTLGQPARLE